MKKKISIITPVCNEEGNIIEYYNRLSNFADKMKDQYEFEFIITDNNSTDNTLNLFKEIAKKDVRFKIFKLSRNFGFQKSIWTGYSKATGDAALELDCDLQDPPELIETFLKEWEKGHKVVYGIRKVRQEGKFITFLRKAFYRILNKMSDVNMPVDAGDFMLIDRVIIDHLKKIKSHNLYIRGIIFSFGYKRKGIEYKRDKRKEGKSKFPFFKMCSLALDGIISRSIIPLRVASIFGVIVSFATFLFIVGYFLLKIFSHEPLPRGFTTLVILILFSVGMSSIFLGIIGEYLAKVYLQLNQMPITLIEEEINYECHESQINEITNAYTNIQNNKLD